MTVCVRSVLRCLAAIGLVLLPGGLRAAEVRAGSLVVQDPWSRATPGGARVGAGYLTIQNVGTAPDRLIGAEAEVAGRVEIHETSESEGVSRMRPVDRIAAAPGARVEFKPNGYHLMLVDLNRPLKQGERFGATLIFEVAGRVPVEFEVRGIGAGAGSHQAH